MLFRPLARLSPRGIFFGEANDGIHDFLTDARSVRLSFVTGVELFCDKFVVPAENRIRRENGCQFQQSLTTDGVSLDGQSPTLMVTQQQGFFSSFFSRASIWAVWDSMICGCRRLTMALRAASRMRQGCSRKGMLNAENRQFWCREVKSSGRDERLWRAVSPVFHGVLSSAQFFDPMTDILARCYAINFLVRSRE